MTRQTGSRPRVGPALAALGLLYLVSQFARNSLGVIAGDLEADLGVKSTQTALLAGALFGAYGLAQMPAARLLATVGPRVVVPAAGVLLALALYGFSYAEHFAGLFAFRVLMGLAAAPMIAGSLKILMDIAGEARFAELSGWQTTFGRTGVVVATMPLALLVTAEGWRTDFAWSGLATIAVALLAALAVTRAADAGTPSSTLRADAPVAALLRRPVVIAAIAFQGMTAAVGGVLLGLWGGPWLNDVYGMSVTMRGFTLMVMAVAWAASAAFWGSVAQRNPHPVRLAVAGGYLVALLLTVAAVWPMPLAALVAWLALVGVATGSYPVVLAQVRTAVPKDALVQITAILTAGTMLIVFAVQVATGLVLDAFPGSPGHHPPDAYAAIFWLMGVLIAAAAFVLGRTVR
ncbi:MAG: MFS transporter [Hyphomicrobiales bacterium]